MAPAIISAIVKFVSTIVGIVFGEFLRGLLPNSLRPPETPQWVKQGASLLWRALFPDFWQPCSQTTTFSIKPPVNIRFHYDIPPRGSHSAPSIVVIRAGECRATPSTSRTRAVWHDRPLIGRKTATAQLPRPAGQLFSVSERG